MSREKGKSLASKHAGKEVKIDEQIFAALRSKAIDGKISCRNAMDIASKLNKGTDVVGLNIDLAELHINECQLGLFGYSPKKRIVKPAESIAPGLEAAIRQSLTDGCLSCISVWAIADDRKISRMNVASACEKMDIKIKPCQIGAF